MITQAENFAREFIGHVLALVLAGVAAWLSNHGWHTGIDVIPASVSVVALGDFLRLAVRGLAKAIRSGKLEADLVAAAKKELPVVVKDIEDAA